MRDTVDKTCSQKFNEAEVAFRNKTLVDKFLFIFHLSVVSEMMRFVKTFSSSGFKLTFKLFSM